MAAAVCRSALVAAAVCRSALMAAGSRCISARSRILTHSSLSALNSISVIPTATRFVSVLGTSESRMPLHSAIASARLTSNISLDSTCWSCLSQSLTLPS